MKYQDIFPLPILWLQDVDVAFADTAARWAEKEVMARRLEFGEDFEKLLLPAMGALFSKIGLQSLLWPEDLGGVGQNDPLAAITLAATLEQVARADVGIAFVFANTFAAQSAVVFGQSGQTDFYKSLAKDFTESEKPKVISLVLPDYGEIGESPAPGFSGLCCQVKATKKNDGIILSGKNVRPQCSGVDANYFAVVCASKEAPPTLTMVPGDAEGLTRGDAIFKTGLAANRNADLDFTDVFAPADQIITTGLESLHKMLSWYVLGCCGCYTGANIACWEILKEWGETRVIKGRGQIFKDNPLVAASMAEIGANITTNRLLYYNLAKMLADPKAFCSFGDEATYASALAISDAIGRGAMTNLDRAMELMASAGYATEWNLERYWRDVKTVQSTTGPLPAAWMEMARQTFSCRPDQE